MCFLAFFIPGILSSCNSDDDITPSDSALSPACSDGFCQEQILFKQIDTTKIYLKAFYPEPFDRTREYPAIVFFFGGGWSKRNIEQFEPQAKYFSKRGSVCFIADYRVKEIHQTTPFESLKDAKSAIRFIRANANKLHINTSKIAAAGGSAGGHLAAATALIENYNESTDDLKQSCIPNALILFNPVIDNGPGGYGYNIIGDAYKNFSPLHNIREGAPPTILFLGTKDKLIPVETAKYYQELMENVNSRCELYLYEDQEHGFFNYKNFEFYKKTVSEADKFLQSIGFLEKEPIIEIE